MAIGLANVVSGFLGGLGGNDMFGESMLVFLNGGRTRVVAVTTALCVLIATAGAYPVLNYIPVASLVGIMMVVVFHTFKWSSLRLMLASLMSKDKREKYGFHYKVQRFDTFVILTVTILTLFTNLAIAVIAGVMLSSTNYTYEVSRRLKVEAREEKRGNEKWKIYEVYGDLFFASQMQFTDHFKFQTDPANIHIAFGKGSAVLDYSAMKCISAVVKRYGRIGKHCIIEGLDNESIHMIKKAKTLTSSWFDEALNPGREDASQELRVIDDSEIHVKDQNLQDVDSNTRLISSPDAQDYGEIAPLTQRSSDPLISGLVHAERGEEWVNGQDGR